MNELYTRQDLMGVRIPKKAMVIGVGGIGTWVALLLAMSGVEELTIWDGDVLEESNRARLPYRVGDVGKPKTEILANMLLSIRPGLNLSTYSRATKESLDSFPCDVEVVFNCADEPGVQKVIYNWCQRYKIEYIKAGYDGYNITDTNRLPIFSTGNVAVGYQITPSWVIPAVMSAAAAVLKVCCGVKDNLYGDIRNISLTRRNNEEPIVVSGASPVQPTA